MSIVSQLETPNVRMREIILKCTSPVFPNIPICKNYDFVYIVNNTGKIDHFGMRGLLYLATPVLFFAFTL